MKKKHTCLMALLVALAIGPAAKAAESQALNPRGTSTLEQGFRTVPDADKPWVYWWWLNGNVDRRTITRDLEAMKQQGFGGLLMFDARGYHGRRDHP
jgi:hypothetical protein